MYKVSTLLIVVMSLFLVGVDDCENNGPSDAIKKAQKKLNEEIKKNNEKIKKQLKICIKYNTEAKKILEMFQVYTLSWPDYLGAREDRDLTGYQRCMGQMSIYKQALQKHGITNPHVKGIYDLQNPGNNPTITIRYYKTDVDGMTKCKASLKQFQDLLKQCKLKQKQQKKETDQKKLIVVQKQEQSSIKNVTRCTNPIGNLEYGLSELACVCCDANLVVKRGYNNQTGNPILSIHMLDKACASNCGNHNLVKKTKLGCLWGQTLNPQPTPAEQPPPLRSSRKKHK